MLGVSLVSADDWILRYFASGGAGDISRLNYAKRLFAVPISILGQATGQASMPFFASLWEQGKRKLFADTVNQTVYRISAVAFLASAWMMAAALPIIDLAFRHGHFTFADARETATYFFWFALSLALWSAQAQYARAFYGAGDTLTPMVASTIIVALSLPDLSQLLPSVRRYRTGDRLRRRHPDAHGRSRVAASSQEDGFAWSSFLGENCRRHCSRGAFAGFAAYGASRMIVIRGSLKSDLMALTVISVVWAVAVVIGLWITKSNLPGELRRRRKPAAATQPEPMVDRTTGGVEP